jgi:sugar phosphate isomerase/epimerase
MSTLPWTLGYGTNGFTDHPLDRALDVMQSEGYGAVALTLGHPHFDPFAPDADERARALADDLRERGMRVVVETGARYLLDPWRKHRPTLVDVEAASRMAFLRRAVEIAEILGAECVSLWSGVLPDEVAPDEGRALLVERLREIVAFAAERGVVVAIEPEPGMLVETVADALAVRDALGEPANLGLTVDLGHCVVVEPDGVVGALRAAGALLRNVQADDMRPEAHEHLPFGEGELDLAAALATLREIDYRGVVAVELPRHAHAAPALARASFRALTAAAAPAPHPWVGEAAATVAADWSKAPRLFAEAGRRVGREPVVPGDDATFAVTADDEARVAIMRALYDAGAPPDAVVALYTRGDDAERRGALRGWNALAEEDLDEAWRTAGIGVVTDALRANDTRLTSTAMGAFALHHLDDHTWRHGVLKLVFQSVPLRHVDGLSQRADDELAAMATRFAEERRAAGRSVPDDLVLLLDPSERL